MTSVGGDVILNLNLLFYLKKNKNFKFIICYSRVGSIESQVQARRLTGLRDAETGRTNSVVRVET